jgi:hypothetical protein
MSQANDAWYVRLPDGRVLRAKSTEAVRHHLNTGRLPRDIWVRRTQDEEWANLEEVPDFADVFGVGPTRGRHDRTPATPEYSPPESLWSTPTASGARGRDDRMQLQTVGVRGMVEELLNAMDSTLVRVKLRVACLAALVATFTLTLAGIFAPEVGPPWDVLVWIGAGLAVLIDTAIASALLTQMTFVELSHSRPPRWIDAKAGMGQNVTRLALTYLLVIGVPLLIFFLLPLVPKKLFPAGGTGVEMVTGVVMIVELILLVVLGPLLGFSLLLGPVLVVEDLPAGRGVREWWQFARQHFTRLFLYEALAAALAGVASLPLIFPVAVLAPSLLGPGFGEAGSIGLAVIRLTLSILAGLALTPLVAYLVVANVFVYLNLRYEQGLRR